MIKLHIFQISDVFAFFPILQVIHFITFYIPLWGAILYNGFTYLQVTRMLNNATRVCLTIFQFPLSKQELLDLHLSRPRICCPVSDGRGHVRPGISIRRKGRYEGMQVSGIKFVT